MLNNKATCLHPDFLTTPRTTASADAVVLESLTLRLFESQRFTIMRYLQSLQKIQANPYDSRNRAKSNLICIRWPARIFKPWPGQGCMKVATSAVAWVRMDLALLVLAIQTLAWPGLHESSYKCSCLGSHGCSPPGIGNTNHGWLSSACVAP